MDPIESIKEASREIVHYAQRYGVDLKPVLKDILFTKDRRWVVFWKKDNKYHYNMQGAVRCLPTAFRDSLHAFQGGWSESGFVEDVSEAYDLVKSWLIDQLEVDELPKRCITQRGIG
jgi:hypothetical protein